MKFAYLCHWARMNRHSYSFFFLPEILVDNLGEVLEEDADIKFLGLTLFALVPNITEFMNAMSFAIYGNIALRYECYKYQY